MALDNREMAALLWLAILLMFCLAQPKVRAHVPDLLRTAMHPKVLLPVLLMLGYLALEVWLGYRLSLWRSDLLKPTILWVAFSAFSMFFAFDEASKKPHFIRHSLTKAIGIAAFLEFFINIAPMNLAAEFLLQPFMAGLMMLSAAAVWKEEQRAVKKRMDTVVALTGFAILAYATREVYFGWGRLDKEALLLQLALPVWLSIGLLPYICAVSLTANYGMAFVRMKSMAGSRKVSWRIKLALIARLHFRTRAVSEFAYPWTEQMATAPTFSTGWRIVSDFLKARGSGKAAADEGTKKASASGHARS